jgi:hypothetical protein
LKTAKANAAHAKVAKAPSTNGMNGAAATQSLAAEHSRSRDRQGAGQPPLPHGRGSESGNHCAEKATLAAPSPNGSNGVRNGRKVAAWLPPELRKDRKIAGNRF